MLNERIDNCLSFILYNGAVKTSDHGDIVMCEGLSTIPIGILPDR